MKARERQMVYAAAKLRAADRFAQDQKEAIQEREYQRWRAEQEKHRRELEAVAAAIRAKDEEFKRRWYEELEACKIPAVGTVLRVRGGKPAFVWNAVAEATDQHCRLFMMYCPDATALEEYRSPEHFLKDDGTWFGGMIVFLTNWKPGVLVKRVKVVKHAKSGKSIIGEILFEDKE